MAATRREMGLVGSDQLKHVVVPHLNGALAMCGAGKIVQRIPGWFDPADPSACAACAESLGSSG